MLSGRCAAPRPWRVFLPPVLLALSLAPARAQDDMLPPLSFVFARHAGASIYDVQGRPVQIYNLPFSVTVRSAEERRWGLAVTLPVTAGFFDFKPSDVLETGLPRNVGTVSFVPGVRAHVTATRRWTLSPFAELGAAKDLEGGNVVRVSGLGLGSEVRLTLAGLDGRVVNRALVAGSRDRETGTGDSYGEFRSGFELAVPVGARIRGVPADVGGFVSNYFYFEPPDDFLAPFATTSAHDGRIRVQWEIGATFGTRQSVKLWKVPLPRIGLSYRFGDGPDAARLVFGLPF